MGFLKKILILAYDFPPNTFVGGQRPYSWLQYLCEFGYYPIVVTRHWDGDLTRIEDHLCNSTNQQVSVEKTARGKLIRVPYRSNLRDRLIIKQGKDNPTLFRKIVSLSFYLGQYFTTVLDPINAIYQQAQKVISQEKIELIIATGEPFVLFKHAFLLSRDNNIPWIADYRDGWTDNYTREYSGILQKLLTKIELSRERKYTSNALCIISVTPFLKDKISETTHLPGYWISNGMDVELFNQKVIQNKLFTIAYTGFLYDFPYMEIFETAFKKFIAAYPEKDKQFLFVGIGVTKNSSSESIRHLVEHYPDYIKILPRVSVKESAIIQQKAHVLLNLIPHNLHKTLPVKMFGYAAARRPVIAVETDPRDDIFFFPNRDIQTFARTAEDLFALLVKYYQMYLSGKEITTSITDEEIEGLSRKARVRELAEVLDHYLLQSN